MRRTQTVTITVEHQRLTLLLAPITDRNKAIVVEVDGAAPCPDSAACPQCGAPWVPVHVSGFDEGTSGSSTLWSPLQQRGLHLDLSSAGLRGICSRSLERARGEAAKESDV